LFFSKQKLLLV